MKDHPVAATEKPASSWRFKLGLAVFVAGVASPLLIPVVTASGLATRWKALLSGALAVGIPEVFTVIAVAIMGKSGFEAIKRLALRFIKKHGPPERVSPARYRIGLVMFSLPLLLGWLGPYVQHHIPGYEAHRLPVAITGDLLFVASLFVLGGEFWDKLRALYLRNARVVLEGSSRN